MINRIVIGSRGSRLALAQTSHTADRIRAIAPDAEVTIQVITTKGDRNQETPLPEVGGKGLFTLELEAALLDGSIDLAIHSLKDLPTDLPPGLGLLAVPSREDPCDALVCAKYASLRELPQGATIGTSSLRRQAQLLAYRRDFNVVPLRGNVDTRLRRVVEGDIDAAILACAGLKRLDRGAAIREVLPPEIMVPAVGQGALGLEGRRDDTALKSVLAKLNDPATEAEVTAERALLAVLEGGCQVPIGALARVEGKTLTLTACVCSPDGTRVLHAKAEGHSIDAVAIGQRAAKDLLQQGAAEIIAAAR